jgi:opacity protein-like surface antigen
MAAVIAGIAIMAVSAGTYGLGEHRARPPAEVSFVESDVWSTGGFGTGGFFGYEFENDFKTQNDGLNSHTTGGLPTNNLRLNGVYEISDNNWRLKSYVGFSMIDVSDQLLGNRIHDRFTAYQVRGGVTLGLTQKLLGSLEYHWTNGSRPHFSLSGIPVKFEVDRHGFLVGMNYRY